MKRILLLTISILMIEIVARSAWAAGSMETYHGNTLVLLFLGVCVLFAVTQMVPALILIMRMISGFTERIAARRQVAVVDANQDKTR